MWSDVTKLDQEHAPPGAVLRDLQQIHDAREAGPTSQLRRDIGEPDLEQARDHDVARR